MAAAFKAKQDEIRRLMKERRENLKDYKNRIESPFAKYPFIENEEFEEKVFLLSYNNLGQLFCTICNIQIKNNGLWASHVAGKIHKENALKKKKGPANIASKTVPPVKEKRCEDMPPPVKKLKVDAGETVPISQKTEPVQTSGKISLLGVYSSSDSEDDTEPMDVSNDVPNNNALPKDFFDAAPSLAFPVNGEQSSTEQKKPAEAPVNSVDALPEGFFDDPVQDAKARNIEYKDPIEEEWERYQKAIAEETNVSKNIIEEDLEESTLERDITEIDLQINLWEKAKELQTRAEEASSKVPSSNNNDGSSGNTDDEFDEDDLLDWRSKGVRRR